VIDRLFLVTYGCIAFGVLVSTVEAATLAGRPDACRRVDRFAGVGLPLVFLVLVATCVWR
jgi:hypothetical protein